MEQYNLNISFVIENITMLEVYHFDINGTVIGTDSIDNASIEDMVSEAFSRSINIEGKIYNEGETTYYNHIKTTTKDYKKKIYNFLTDFPEHQENYDKLLYAFKRGLFESFLEVIDKKIKNNKALLVFRTFGNDRNFVADMLKSYDMEFINYRPEELNDVLYRDCIERGYHIMVKDDYHIWNNNNKIKEFGKPVKYFEGIIQYAFDDNLCMNCEKGVNFFHVNTYKAALDKNYYINMITK